MNRIVIKSKVGSDGILKLSLPMGMQEADKEVQVTVESCTTAKQMTQAEWSAWVDSMAGSWQGDFERSPQADIGEPDSGPTLWERLGDVVGKATGLPPDASVRANG